MEGNNGELMRRSSPSYLPKSTQNEVSVYSGELTMPARMKAVKALSQAFPALQTGFFDVLLDRLDANGFSDQRLYDAVAWVIDNCPYPSPTICNIVSYDRTVKLYTWEEMIARVDDWGVKIWDHFKIIKTPWGKRWVAVEDYELIKNRYGTGKDNF